MQLPRYLHLQWLLLWPMCLAKPSIFAEQISATQLLGSHFGIPDIPVTYDYVIVGGGTAGLVMARRLAANASFTVAVIEAGGFYEFDNGNYSEIPGFAAQFTEPTAGPLKNPLVDWYQYTQPQSSIGGRAPLYTSGKTFGGGSARNFLSYQRTSAGALQKWADEVDDQSYTFDNLLPYFKKSIHFTPPDASAIPPNVSTPYRPEYFSSTGSPVQVSFPHYFNAISSWLGNAFEELGFARLPAFSDGRLFGWSYFTYEVDPASQTRSSSATSFMREALRETTNLNFYKSTLAKKIILDDCQKASGVVVNTGGVEYVLSAAKEVISSTHMASATLYLQSSRKVVLPQHHKNSLHLPSHHSQNIPAFPLPPSPSPFTHSNKSSLTPPCLLPHGTTHPVPPSPSTLNSPLTPAHNTVHAPITLPCSSGETHTLNNQLVCLSNPVFSPPGFTVMDNIPFSLPSRLENSLASKKFPVLLFVYFRSWLFGGLSSSFMMMPP